MRVDFGGRVGEGGGGVKTKVIDFKRWKVILKTKESRLSKAVYQSEQNSFDSLFQTFRLWGQRSLTSRCTLLSERLVQANR